MRRVLSVIVLNEHGVLSRIVGLFSGRGYNIDSLTVAPLENKEFSRINIVTSGNERTFEQIVKQLHKLIPTYKVIESEEFIDKEMALVKIPLNENLGGL
ncbi:acetolactate synthase small subunit, partial [Salmonella enterica subsp. enterica]|nr:acetolactate synthase small subunit [Salmonella enterica subsp. enterica serovar Enteritidis]